MSRRTPRLSDRPDRPSCPTVPVRSDGSSPHPRDRWRGVVPSLVKHGPGDPALDGDHAQQIPTDCRVSLNNNEPKEGCSHCSIDIAMKNPEQMALSENRVPKKQMHFPHFPIQTSKMMVYTAYTELPVFRHPLVFHQLLSPRLRCGPRIFVHPQPAIASQTRLRESLEFCGRF